MSAATVTNVGVGNEYDTWQKMKQGSESMC